MRRMKRPVRLSALLLVFALMLAACNGDNGVDDTDTDPPEDAEDTEDTDDTDDAAAEDADITIGLSISTLANPFFVTLQEGAQDAADEAGIELIVNDAQDDAQAEANGIDDFITQGVDIIVLNPVDSEAAIASVERAEGAGIQVVTVDRAVDDAAVASHVSSDNVLGGELATEFLLESIDSEGTVAQLEGIAGTDATRERGAGFSNVLEGADGVELVSSVTANFSRDEGFSVAQDILQANPELDAIFAQNDEMALGAVEAADGLGILDDLVVIGFDATDDALAAVQDGRMDGTVAQQPFEIGRIGIESAIALAQGEDLDEEVPVDVELVTEDNVDDFLD
jgi:ribose transport system substrate-binding protein